jgi:hypothetical protein
LEIRQIQDSLMTKDKEKENKEKFQDRLNDEVDFLR